MAADDELLIRTPLPSEPTEKRPHRWTVGLSLGALLLAGVSAFYTYRQADEAHNARIDAKKASDAQAGDVERSRKASEDSALAAEKLADIAQRSLTITERSASQTSRATRLSARPYVQLGFYFNDRGAGWTYRNMGLGLAIVRSFEVSLDGHRLRSWNELQKKLDLTGGPITFSVAGPGNIAAPFKTGDVTEIFWVSPADREKLVSNAARVGIATCYCSLYEDCWRSFVSNGKQEAVPERASSCEVIPAGERFGVEVR